MGFWIFILFMELLTPLSLIGFGRYFLKGGPKEINGVFGYRTAMSMKNIETWCFAHRYIGRLWFGSGMVIMPVSVMIMILVLGRDQDLVGTVGGVLIVVQMILLVGTIFPTEVALRKNFDKNGRRR